jgi:hypothetical protein
MDYIKAAINSIKIILDNIGNEQNSGEFFELVGIIMTLLPIIGGIICFIDNKFVSYSKSEKNQAKCLLKEYNKHILNALKKESVFFEEDSPRKLLFYNKVPVKKYHSHKKIRLIKLLFSKYILLGSAGSGKSSVIKKDYMFHCNRIIRFWRIHTGVVYISRQFLNHGIKGISSLDEIIDCIEKTKYKKIYLYIDGIDEFGELKVDEISKKMMSISRKIKKVKITSRTNFAIKNIINHNNGCVFGFKENQRIIVENWKEKQLIDLSWFLLKHLGIDKLQCKNVINKIKQESKNWEKHIDSPLLMKLFLYIVIYGDTNNEINLDNKYLFYSQFITEVISTQRKRQNDFKIQRIQKELDEVSTEVFDAFTRDERFLQNTKNIQALLKPANDGLSIFIHETFFEYFVARNYLIQLSNKSPTIASIKTLCQNYTNDFADFITFALNSTKKETRQQIVNSFFLIYYYTLGSDQRTDFHSKFKGIFNNYSSQIYQAIQKLSEHQFFTLKYEIVFRLGRIDVDLKEISDFLTFVYDYDKNIGVKEDKEYYIAVLQRCCAISCSFLGSERIELDYIKKMIPYNCSGKNNSYIPNNDLANRSHTLLFYGDVVKANIFEFRDDTTNNPYELAFAKRINRLANELPSNITEMDKAQKKKYYFRLFDLATIYTFIFNRRRVLTSKEQEIVSNTRVQFVGASEERNSIMIELKDLILELNENINSAK